MMFRCGVNRRRMQEDEVSSDDVGILWNCYYQRYRALNVDALAISYCQVVLTHWDGRACGIHKPFNNFHIIVVASGLIYSSSERIQPHRWHRPRQHTHESMRPSSLCHPCCGCVVPEREWPKARRDSWYVCVQWNFGTRSIQAKAEHSLQLIISQQQPSLSLHSSTF